MSDASTGNVPFSPLRRAHASRFAPVILPAACACRVEVHSLRRFFPSSGSSFPVKEPSIKREKQNRNKGDSMNTEIQKQLTELALKQSKPFCYSCYKEAPSDRCNTCGSDDLMRLMPEVGCEYGLCRVRHKPYYAARRIMRTRMTYR